MSKLNIKKISADEAKEYFIVDENSIDSPIQFYTLIKDKKGWDKITYYTMEGKK